MGDTVIFEETGERESAYMWGEYADEYYVTLTKFKFYFVSGGGSSEDEIKGDQLVREGYYGEKVPTGFPHEHNAYVKTEPWYWAEEAVYVDSDMDPDREGQVRLLYIRMDSGKFRYEGANYALKGGMAEDYTGEEEGTDGSTGTTSTSTSDFYVSTLDDSVDIGADTDLITEGNFDVHWANLDSRDNWDEGSKNQYNNIEDGEVSGFMFIQKEHIKVDDTTYKNYSPVNTGPSQGNPAVTTTMGYSNTFNVQYSTVEENAIKDKYNHYDGEFKDHMHQQISNLVRKAVGGLNQAKSRYTFKKIDTNRKFKEINVSAFAKDEVAIESMPVATETTTAMTPTAPTTPSSTPAGSDTDTSAGAPAVSTVAAVVSGDSGAY
jgi:hypothetical protein